MAVQLESQIDPTTVNQGVANDDDRNQHKSVNHGVSLETMKAEVITPEVVKPGIDVPDMIKPQVIEPDPGIVDSKADKLVIPPQNFVKPGFSFNVENHPKESEKPKSEPQSPKTINENAAMILGNMRLNRIENTSENSEIRFDKRTSPVSNNRSFSIKRADGTSISLISSEDSKNSSLLDDPEKQPESQINTVVVADAQLNNNSAPSTQPQDNRRSTSLVSNSAVPPQTSVNTPSSAAISLHRLTLPPPVQPASMHRASMVAGQPAKYKKTPHHRPSPIFIPKPGQVPGMPPLINTTHSFHPQSATPGGYPAIPYALNYYPHQAPFAQYYSITPPSSGVPVNSVNSATASHPPTPSYPYPFSPLESPVPFANTNGGATNPQIPGTAILLPNGSWPQMYPGYMARPYSMPGKKHSPGPYSPRMDLKMNDRKFSRGGLQSHMFMRSRKRSRQDLDDDIKCQQCGTRSTPEWRRGPNGFRTLCNACGLYHAKMARKKGEDEASRLLRKRPLATNN